MLRLKSEKQNQLLIIFLVVGFLFGVIYENIFFKGHEYTTILFTQSNLQRYAQTDVIAEKYVWYVFKNRLSFLMLIVVISCVKWKKIFVSICILLFGFFAGVLCAVSVVQLGLKGILLWLAGFFPQIIFYGFVYGMLFTHWFHFPLKQWNQTKIIFIILMFAIGIILEIYVNPLIVKYLISFLL